MAASIFVTLLAGLLLEARQSRRQIVTIGTGLIGFIDVHGVVEGAAEALYVALANGGVAGEAVRLRLVVMARRAAGLAEANNLVLSPLLVRPMTGLALELGFNDVPLVRERAPEEFPALVLDPLVALQAG